VTVDGDLGSHTAEPVAHEELLARVAAGDEAAFAELYDRFAARVLGLIVRVVRDRSQSEEVAQEVFLEVWQKSASYNASHGAALSWVLTLAHRRAVDRVRSSQSSRDRDSREGMRDFRRAFDSVAEAVEISAEYEGVKRAMSRLTKLQRQAVALAFFAGYSHLEVATMLSVPVGTVKTRLRDAMIRLRDEMGVTS
jgi:RNA polymerase sigma-70 factor (ECF subfamily)